MCVFYETSTATRLSALRLFSWRRSNLGSRVQHRLDERSMLHVIDGEMRSIP